MIMKKIVLLTLISVFLASASFAGIVINIGQYIGKKPYPDCPGLGLCKITVSANYPTEGMVNGNLGVNNESSNLTIGIPEAEILKSQPDKIVFFKNKTSVFFEEGFTMPTEINTATKAYKAIVIKAGEYPLTYKNGIYYIEIPF